MACKARSSSCPSQAKLMHGRGDLQGQRTTLNVKLEKPNPLALQAQHPLDRVGMDLRRSRPSSRLLVNDVDKHPRRRTPVALWNDEEDRRANRVKASHFDVAEEHHASFAVLPGDRLRAINDVNGTTAMLYEIMDCVSVTSPKAVDLAISRDISDVLSPPKTSQGNTRRQGSAPARPSRWCKEAENTKLPATPPWTPPMKCRSSSSSRTTSASSSRLRSNSISSIGTSKSGGSARGIDISLVSAGRLCLAF